MWEIIDTGIGFATGLNACRSKDKIVHGDVVQESLKPRAGLSKVQRVVVGVFSTEGSKQF